MLGISTPFLPCTWCHRPIACSLHEVHVSTRLFAWLCTYMHMCTGTCLHISVALFAAGRGTVRGRPAAALFVHSRPQHCSWAAALFVAGHEQCCGRPRIVLRSAASSASEMCTDMCTEMRTDMRIDMRTDMCTGKCACVHTCIQTCTHMSPHGLPA